MTPTATTDERDGHVRGPHRDERDRRVLAAAVVLMALIGAGIPLAVWLSTARSSATFSDSEILDDNRLGAATLDIEVGSDEAVFDARNLAPGDQVSGHLEIANVGTLPLVLTVSAVASDGPLADWLRFSAWTVDESCLPDDVATGRAELLAEDFAITAAGTGPLATSSEPIRLAPEETLVLCLGARLPLDAGNELQGQTLTVNLILDAVHDLVEAAQ